MALTRRTPMPPDADAPGGEAAAAAAAAGDDDAAAADAADAADSPCRICLAEVAPGTECLLRCRCRNGLGRVHMACAERWWITRGGDECEVCGALCAGLPAPVREAALATRRLKQRLSGVGELLAAAAAADAAALGGLTAAGAPFSLLGPQSALVVASYTFCCLLPTCASASALVLLLAGLGLAPLASIVIAVVVGCGPMAHWLLHPSRSAPHVLLVALCTGGAAAGAAGAAALLRAAAVPAGVAWRAAPVAAAALFGGAAGAVVFFFAALPALRAVSRWARRRHARARRAARRAADAGGDGAGGVGGDGDSDGAALPL